VEDPAVSARLFPLSGVVGLMSLALACGGDAVPETHSSTVAAEPAIVAETVTVSLPISIPGQAYVEHDAVVVARTAGIIDSVIAELGAQVTEGQLMAQLENEDQQIALNRAQVLAVHAERMLARSRVLAESGYVARADSEQARYDAEQAGLALRKAQRDFDLTRIVAPFAGVVTSRAARPRRMVQPGDSLFRLTALAPLLVSIRIPESAAGSVAVGSRAAATSLDDRSWSARVIRASPVIDPASGTREVVLQIENHRGLRPGATVMVRIGSAPRIVVAIPRQSVSEGGYVLVRENGRTAPRAIRLGADLPGGLVEVVEGLDAGEQIAGSPRR
jgi:RND family efflux transporter MFP subunit